MTRLLIGRIAVKRLDISDTIPQSTESRNLHVRTGFHPFVRRGNPGQSAVD
ncbi:MAG: hypothetical protein LBP64_01990 [Tannerella sp.]|nr:hypothetical protein [Tannerella sp.]